MKKLPLGKQNFANLRENDYIYVDKTKYIYELIKNSNVYFLSRPRRFGKSLLVSTLKELYKGNKKLFKGLYIYDKWDWTKDFSVITIDFGSITKKSPERLENSLNKYLLRIAMDYSIDFISDELSDRFAELIEKVSKCTGKKVVVLIDEYDKAILDNVDDFEIANANRLILSDFYAVLKSTDEFLEFVFITGVTKFSKTSIFSGLNNLTDLTIDPNYPCICGYTQEELEICFEERLDDLSKKNNVKKDFLLDLIKQWYDGYSWNGKDFLYNPQSILNLLNTGVFNNYWFETGTPTFLMKFIEKGIDTNVLLSPNQTISGTFPNFDINNIDFKTVLLQAGYLTIKKMVCELGKLPVYTLGIPNQEVNDSLYGNILAYYTNNSAESIPPIANKMLKEIVLFDEKGLQESFNLLISNIPYTLYGNVKEDIREANYHMLFLSWLQLLGLDIQGEILTNKGRIDAILKKDDLIVVIEIKYSLNKSLNKLVNEAINQIKDKKYYNPFIDKNVLFLAVAIRDRDVACKMEKFK